MIGSVTVRVVEWMPMSKGTQINKNNRGATAELKLADGSRCECGRARKPRDRLQLLLHVAENGRLRLPVIEGVPQLGELAREDV